MHRALSPAGIETCSTHPCDLLLLKGQELARADRLATANELVDEASGPPLGQGREWWEALKTALGTCSNAFVTASLAQLQFAARLPDGPVSEVAMNAALALIEAVAPKDEIEGTLAVQMAATHSVSMAVLGRIGSAHCGYRLLTAYSNAASKLLRAYTAQVDALRRLRGGGEQHIRVEHIYLNDDAKRPLARLLSSRSYHEYHI
jgi:hypothetical protein